MLDNLTAEVIALHQLNMPKRSTKLVRIRSINYDYLLRFVDRSRLLRTDAYWGYDEIAGALAKKLTSAEAAFVEQSAKRGRGAEETAKIFLFRFRPTATVVSQELIGWLISQVTSIRREVFFFEFPLIDRRMDIVRLNCRSYAYEVKSRRDTFDRLLHQTEAALGVFEYVYAVIDQDLAPLDGLSPAVGIIEAHTDGDAIVFNITRRPKLNTPSSPLRQLQLLSIPEIQALVAERQLLLALDEDPREREWILDHMPPSEVNSVFKQTLRKRYRDRWRKYLSQRYVK